jgi:predicted MFS family arabinose efflux permease
MLGAAIGGWLLDHWSISATFMGGVVFLCCAAVIVSHGDRSRARSIGTDDLCSVSVSSAKGQP